MRHPSAAPLAFVVALLAASAEGAQQPPPLRVEHRPPEALPRPAPQSPRLVRPGQTLTRDMILRRRPMTPRSMQLTLDEMRILARLVGHQ
ncbi:MAG: hypothetical protein Q7V43_35040 [Myxococcales bacterium]|nr:hypothetical protein [Myxococcales bacterium]